MIRGKCVYTLPSVYTHFLVSVECDTHFLVFVLVLENRKLCLGRMCGSVPGVGCECIVCSVLFRMDILLNCMLMCVPLVFGLWWYQVVSSSLKSPAIIPYGMLPSLWRFCM